MELSIIIVTYNSASYIEKCIKSIIENTKNIKYEIIVVDNSSKDDTIARIKNINCSLITIVESENNGFNYGNNRGIEIAKGEYICLLNPDTIIINNAFEILISGMREDYNLGLCGARLLDENLNENISIGVFPSIKESLLKMFNIRNKKYFYASENKRKIVVDYPIGADFLFKSSLIEEIGYLDENYFLYFDETDYAYRIKNNGYKACIFTEAKIIHLQGKSTESLSEFAEKKFLESYIYYNRKFLSKKESYIINIINIISNYIKFIIKFIFRFGDYNYHLKSIKYYKKVIKNLNLK